MFSKTHFKQFYQLLIQIIRVKNYTFCNEKYIRKQREALPDHYKQEVSPRNAQWSYACVETVI